MNMPSWAYIIQKVSDAFALVVTNQAYVNNIRYVKEVLAYIYKISNQLLQQQVTNVCTGHSTDM